MIRTLIVDDHGIVREGLERLLESFDDITVVGVAQSGDDAVKAVPALRPDVILMDLEMPGELDGVGATRALVDANVPSKVLILTSFVDRTKILQALDAGAVGYLLKDSPSEDLVRAVRAAARGDFPIDPKAARVLLSERTNGHVTAGMSSREIEVLTLVGVGMPNKAIAQRLAITERTVKGHLTSVFRTIGVTDRTQAALWANRNGITPSE